jgi:hypothetical protein
MRLKSRLQRHTVRLRGHHGSTVVTMFPVLDLGRPERRKPERRRCVSSSDAPMPSGDRGIWSRRRDIVDDPRHDDVPLESAQADCVPL